MSIVDLRHCCQMWLDSIAKLNDFDMIEKITEGNKCFIDDAVRAFNYNLDTVSVDFEIYPYHMTVSSKRD